MNERSLLSMKVLLEIIRNEISKIDVCKGVYIGPIIYIPATHDGCNWKLKLEGNENCSASLCADAFQTTILDLRTKYNLIPLEDL